jgi:hypothetical protein
MASSMNNLAWVRWMNVLMGEASRQAYAATLPPDRFSCLLDELPLHLIPAHSRRSWRQRPNQELFLNPDCIFCLDEQLPDDLVAEKEATAAFALNGTIAWVRDPAFGARLPFWLGPHLELKLENVDHGQPLPATITDDEKALLLAARIAMTGEERRIGADKPDRKPDGTAAMFHSRGYAPVSDLIHPFHIAALRRYYRYLIRTGAIRLGDGQSPRRYVAHNEPVARFFHQVLAPTLSLVVGEPLKPSYVYMASYLSGAELKKHTDRPQCEFSVTLCLDFSPEPELQTPWPIQLDTPSGTIKVYQALGDGLAYRGMQLPHFREILGEGQTSTSIFFHYVSEDFTGSLD